MEHSSGCWVGIDVSKDWLDVAVGTTGTPFQVPNTPVGFRTILTRLRGTAVAGVVAESTGFYHRGITTALAAAGYQPAIINPSYLKRFRESGLPLAKTDRLDARLLARYGAAIQPRATMPKGAVLQDLTDLVSARHDHVTAKDMWQHRQRNQHLPGTVQTEAALAMAMHQAAITRLTKQIAELIASDPILAHRAALLQSVPGIALVRSAIVLAVLPELGSESGKTIAALVGLAPYAHDSGHRTGHRAVRRGRSLVKRELVLLVCSPHVHPLVRARRERLRQPGRHRRAVHVAVARWLVTVLNAMLRDDLTWEELIIVRHA